MKATMQFRTTLDQAGRIAGLAGELDATEAEVMRQLVDMALETPRLLSVLRQRITLGHAAALQAEVERRAAHERVLAAEDSL